MVEMTYDFVLNPHTDEFAGPMDFAICNWLCRLSICDNYMECRGRAVECIGLKFWCCQNVGSNPDLAGRYACVLEQDT